MQHKHKGALAELKACAWLLEQGYEVYRNVSQHGDADVVVFRDGKTLRLDIKTAPASLTIEQLNNGISLLIVHPDGMFTIESNLERFQSRRSVCEYCDQTFIGRKASMRFCSSNCRTRSHLQGRGEVAGSLNGSPTMLPTAPIAAASG